MLSPGKLVLVGEYAVLDDVPAVVIAIDRGVACDVDPSGQATEVVTPDGDSRFVAPALAGAPSGRYHFRSWNPVDLPGKPGFGGSAAACVAACIAAGRPPSDALAIHHRVQGSGSGIDVLASIHGGMGTVSAGRWTAAPPRCPVVIYSGQSAKTGPRVQAYLGWTDRAAFLADSDAISRAFLTDPHGALAASGALLVAMSRAAGIDYLTPGLAQVQALAKSHGGVAKPSGAGGGDCAVAYFDDADDEHAFIDACAAAGLPHIPVAAAPGAHWAGQAPLRR